MPVGRSKINELEPPEELDPAPSLPVGSVAKAAAASRDIPAEPQIKEHDPARGAGMAAAESSFGHGASSAAPVASKSGKRALIQYDYEKAEDNEVELKEGEYVTEIEMVDDDWWMGRNSSGETGLFPSNYVDLVEDDEAHDAPAAPGPPAGKPAGPTATAQYDYEAAEDNELSFPDGATVLNVVSYCLQSNFKRLHANLVPTGIPRRRLVVWRVQWQDWAFPSELCGAR
jgi:hypothetical protein